MEQQNPFGELYSPLVSSESSDLDKDSNHMKDIKEIIVNIVSLLSGKTSVYSTASSIKGNYSYGRKDMPYMSGDEYDGEMKR